MIVEFTLDPSRSTMSLAGDLAGERPLSEQAPGSMTTSISGQFRMLIDYTSGVPTHFRVIEDSLLLDLAELPGVFQPLSLPADAAASIVDLLPGITPTIAFRNVGFQLQFENDAPYLIPLNADHTFSTQNMTLRFQGGTVDYDVPGFGFSDSLRLAGPVGEGTPLVGNIEFGASQLSVHIPYELRSTFAAPLELDLNLSISGDLFATAAIMPLLEPVQWAKADGGNGHYYQFVPDPTYFERANIIARSSEHMGVSGRVASITSPEENLFISNTFGDLLEGAWIGARRLFQRHEPYRYWAWPEETNDLPFENWAPGHPNDTDPDIHYATFGATSNEFGRHWNGVDFGATGYVIEYNLVPEPSTRLLALLGMLGIGLAGWRRHVV
jgi:hypothetical protein